MFRFFSWFTDRETANYSIEQFCQTHDIDLNSLEEAIDCPVMNLEPCVERRVIYCLNIRLITGHLVIV